MITGLVYATNGTDGSYTYLMLTPVLAGAARYGARGGVAAGAAGALVGATDLEAIVDDFGMLPATDLKIDRAFIRPLEGDARSRRLVLAMIESGHTLGMSVTAEAIETRGQAQILADDGCDLRQGFLWSPARPAGELRQWFVNHRARGGDSANSGVVEGEPQPT